MVGLEYPFTMWSLSALIRFTSVGLVGSSKLELGCVQRGFIFAATCSTQDPHASPFAEQKGQQCGYRVSIEQSGSWVHVLLAAAGSIQASCHPLHHILLQCEAWVHSFDLLQLVWSVQASWNLDVCNVVSFSLQHAAHKIRTQAPLQSKKVNSAVTELALSRVGHIFIFYYMIVECFWTDPWVILFTFSFLSIYVDNLKKSRNICVWPEDPCHQRCSVGWLWLWRSTDGGTCKRPASLEQHIWIHNDFSKL